MTGVLEFLLTRRSVLAGNLSEPGPSPAEVEQLLTAAIRVPDHKKLAPWRFIVFRGESRDKFGQVLANACLASEPDASPARLETERGRFNRAPVVIAVISSPVDHPAVPKWEQILSAGASCTNLLNAVFAIGYSGQWITEWYAFDPNIHAALELSESEQIAGFVYVGTATQSPKERDRPDPKAKTTYWGEEAK